MSTYTSILAGSLLSFISDVSHLYPLSFPFLVSLARGLLILLIFSKNYLLVSLIFLYCLFLITLITPLIFIIYFFLPYFEFNLLLFFLVP